MAYAEACLYPCRKSCHPASFWIRHVTRPGLTGQATCESDHSYERWRTGGHGCTEHHGDIKPRPVKRVPVVLLALPVMRSFRMPSQGAVPGVRGARMVIAPCMCRGDVC